MGSSSEIVDSGKVSGQKSNFSQTCSLLSQYLKEKGGFGELSLGLNRSFESNGVAAKTMNLLPMLEKSGQNMEVPARNDANNPVNLFPQAAGFYSSTVKEELQSDTTDNICVARALADTAQMTIFYGGQVLVFNDFPSDKAREIMLLASKGSPVTGNCFAPPHTTPPKPAESASSLVAPISSSAAGIPPFGVTGLIPENPQTPLYPRMNDLPLSRKASLTRFLEKRKDRITAKAPYQTNSSKSAENKTWLGFGPQFQPHLQIERLA